MLVKNKKGNVAQINRSILRKTNTQQKRRPTSSLETLNIYIFIAI